MPHLRPGSRAHSPCARRQARPAHSPQRALHPRPSLISLRLRTANGHRAHVMVGVSRTLPPHLLARPTRRLSRRVFPTSTYHVPNVHISRTQKRRHMWNSQLPLAGYSLALSRRFPNDVHTRGATQDRMLTPAKSSDRCALPPPSPSISATSSLSLHNLCSPGRCISPSQQSFTLHFTLEAPSGQRCGGAHGHREKPRNAEQRRYARREGGGFYASDAAFGCVRLKKSR
ncbi:hypothetical protein BD310DRAFT_453638 [Dichomitus squalens]|uniref:Uncharacterized protein n=1 Tax=Dichomitus squalens TaxID=114155 RepID=A0A4Q9PVX6_9APHY|nr:hypothetical protein BD310DRAFT_453638 [Dichomitus squalens]